MNIRTDLTKADFLLVTNPGQKTEDMFIKDYYILKEEVKGEGEEEELVNGEGEEEVKVEWEGKGKALASV